MGRKNYDVEAKTYLVVCPKVGQPLAVSITNCAECPFHDGVHHIGKINVDAQGNMISKEDVMIEADEISLEPNVMGRMNSYNLICKFPRVLQTSVMGTISAEEVTDGSSKPVDG